MHGSSGRAIGRRPTGSTRIGEGLAEGRLLFPVPAVMPQTLRVLEAGFEEGGRCGGVDNLDPSGGEGGGWFVLMLFHEPYWNIEWGV